MKKCGAFLVTLTLAATAAGAASAQTAQPVVRVYRSLLADGTTSVDGLLRVDPDVLGTTTCDYTVSVDVKDPAAKDPTLVLRRHDEWSSKCPTKDGAIAPALEHFVFGIPAGMLPEVDVEVAVAAKGGGKSKLNRVRVKALSPKSLVSDLILARKIGFYDAKNTTEFNMGRNTMGIRGATEIMLDPDESDLWYYLELYPQNGRSLNGSASMVVRRNGDNAELTRRELQKLTDVKVAQPLAGKVNLGGLADGEYTFDVIVQLADTTIVTSHPFMVGTPAVAVADAGGAATGYFYTIPDAEIETTFGAAVLFGMSKQDMDLYNSLSTNGKRAWLTRYFGAAAPDPNRKPETMLDAFLSRSRTVQAQFSERTGRGRQEGWKTDRGRVYIRNGDPTNRVSRPSPKSGSPYEIFYYASNRGLFYLFVDDTRAGNYRLMYTNDPTEQSMAGWDRKVGPEAVDDMRSLGIRVVAPNTGNGGGMSQQN